MEYRYLGQSGLQVSTYALGTMTFGNSQWGLGGVDQTLANQMVDLCLDHGVNLFDSANNYSLGESEEILGRALKGRRHQVVLATKGFSPVGDGVNDHGLSRKHLYDALHDSLRRLDTDYIDLYQLHGADPSTPIEETLSTLDDFVRQGKVRYIGLSNFPAWRIAQAQSAAIHDRYPRFISAQMYYSLVNRDIEHEVILAARHYGLGIIVWSPLSGGVLTGKYRHGTANGRIKDLANSFPPFYQDAGSQVLEPLEAIASAHSTSMAAVSLNWAANRPSVTSVLIGARTLEQLKDNLTATDIVLTPEEHQRLTAAGGPPPMYPGWMQ